MTNLIELWILDNMDMGPFCPSCDVDVQKILLDKCFQLNKHRKWSSKVTIRCPFCKKFIEFEVEWIPECVTAMMVQV